MDPKPEVLPPQNPADVKVEITKKELDDLTHKAEVSSQNFERAKKAEDKVKELEGAPLDTVPSDQLSEVRGQLAEVNGKLAKAEVLKAYPVLEDKWDDFTAFHELPENKGLPLATAAKAFVVEKELLTPRRPGLERPTGGTPIPVKTGLTADEAKALREGDSKKYREELLAGRVQVQ